MKCKFQIHLLCAALLLTISPTLHAEASGAQFTDGFLTFSGELAKSMMEYLTPNDSTQVWREVKDSDDQSIFCSASLSAGAVVYSYECYRNGVASLSGDDAKNLFDSLPRYDATWRYGERLEKNRGMVSCNKTSLTRFGHQENTTYSCYTKLQHDGSFSAFRPGMIGVVN